MKLTPQQRSAVVALYEKIVRGIADLDLRLEIEAMRVQGINLKEAFVNLVIEPVEAEREPLAPAESDQDFLRSLRIAPDLEAK